MLAAEQRLADEERGQAGNQRGRKDDSGKYRELGPQDRKPARDDGHRGPNHSGAVFAAEQQDTEHSEREDGEGIAFQAGADQAEPGEITGVEGGVWLAVTAENSELMPIMRTEPISSVHIVDRNEGIGPLRNQHPLLGHLTGVRRPAVGGRGSEGRSHDATFRVVSVQRAVVDRVVGEFHEGLFKRCALGCQFINRQMRLPGGVRSVPRTAPGRAASDSSLFTVTSGASSRSRSFVASGVRTVTGFPPARAMNSSTVVSAMSLPAADHHQAGGGQGHLAHQVRGDEDGAPFKRPAPSTCCAPRGHPRGRAR